MVAIAPKFTHVTAHRGPEATVARVHNTNSWFEYQLVRPHGSNVFEICGSFGLDEAAVRLDPEHPDDHGSISILRTDGWSQANMEDPGDAAEVAAARRRFSFAQELVRLQDVSTPPADVAG